MTDAFHRLSTPVKAWQYTRQPQTDWPQWVRDYRVSTSMGLQVIGAAPGVLLIPTAHGPTINVVDGQWLVLEHGLITSYKPELFETHFVTSDAEAATPAAPEPVVEAAPTPKPAARKAETPVVEAAPAEAVVEAADEA